MSYPDFETITIKHKDLISEKNKGFEPYSDYNTLSLLSWNIDGLNSLCILNDNLIIKLVDYLGDSFLYLFLGSTKVEESMRTLIRDHHEASCIPEPCIPSGKDFNSVLDRDNFDYVFDLKKFSSLTGGVYRPLRKKIATFERKYPNFEIKAFDIKDRAKTKEVLALTKEWGETHGFDKKKIAEDILMTEKFLEYSLQFDCFMLGVYVAEKLVAFTFNELLPDSWAMGHFGKAINSYDACSVYAEYATAKYLLDKGFKFLNHQQDTGILGLREYKESLRPSRYLKKYTITLKD